MVSDIGYLINAIMLLFDHKFTIYGFSISFFDIFIFVILSGIIGNALYHLFE